MHLYFLSANPDDVISSISSTLDRDIAVGFEVVRTVEKVNEIFGSYLLCEISITLLGETIGLYLSTTFFFALAEDLSSQWHPLILGLQNIFYFLFCLTKHIQWMQKGQQISKEYDSVRKALICTRKKYILHLTRVQEVNLETLIEKFAKDSPIRPAEIFSLNYSDGLSALGLGLTYVIVLLQFKVGETAE